MGKTLPILVVVGAIACGYYILVQDAIFEASGRGRLSPSQEVARKAAGAGYVRGAELLYESFSDTSFGGRYASDSFRVNIDVVGKRAVVSSLGLTRTDSGFVDHIVRAEFLRNVNGPGSLPDFLEASIFAGHQITGDLAGLASLIPGDEPCVSAATTGVATNSEIPLCPTSSGEIPPLYASDVHLAPHSHVEGDMVMPQRIGDGASARSPFIWHVAGDLLIAEPVVSHGYVLFLVDGTIRIAASVSVDKRTERGDESSLALYAGQDILIDDGIIVEAQLFAASDAQIGRSAIIGSIAAAGDVELNKSTVRHRLPSRALIANWVNPAETITMLTYDEQ